MLGWCVLVTRYNIGDIINPSHVIIISTGVRFTAGHQMSPSHTDTLMQLQSPRLTFGYIYLLMINDECPTPAQPLANIG